MKCDELKWKWAYFPYLDAPEKQHESAVNAGYVKVLLKDEADKVIEELKHQRDGAFGLTNSGLTLDDISQMARKQLDHQKYKRCLAMAKWCDDAARLATWDTDFHRCRWYNKWMQHWLELAEKFKGAK